MKVKFQYTYLFDGKIYKDEEMPVITNGMKLKGFRNSLLNVKKTEEIMKKKDEEVNGFVTGDYSDGNICCKCQYLLKCPKMTLSNPSELSKLWFIKSALLVRSLDCDARRNYLEALKQYQKEQDELDYEKERRQNLEKRLKDSGINVEIFNVYKCSKFLDDESSIVIPRTKHR